MGYISLQFDKVKGTSDTRMSEHIERKTMPSNADSSRTHLNRELIRFPEGVRNRNEAISHRLQTAGIRRKIADNQVRAIRILLSGTHEDLIQVAESGRLDEWCEDNLQWLYDTYGRENTVSAVLHMDEKTPHIHATVVPIVQGERRKAKQEKDNGKRKYRKKSTSAARLCADDVLTREKMLKYHDSYAALMQKYGLERGVKGSEARHITTQQYYRELKKQNTQLEQDNAALLTRQQEARKELSETKAQIQTEKLKKATTNTMTAITGAVGSLFGSGKIEKLEQEKAQLIEQLKDKDRQISHIRLDMEQERVRHKAEMNELNVHHQMEITGLENRLADIRTYFPAVDKMMPIVYECKQYGFVDEAIKTLVRLKPVKFSGTLYSRTYRQKVHTDSSTAQVDSDPQRKGQFRLCIDGHPIGEWFKLMLQAIRERLNMERQQEMKPRRGMRR